MTEQEVPPDDVSDPPGPVDEAERRPTMGSVTLLAAEDEAYYSTGESWEAVSQGADPPGPRPARLP